MKFNGEKYEYCFQVELKGDATRFMRIPMSLVTDVELGNGRVALLAYLLMYRGLNNRVIFSIPKFVEWAGFKRDSHTGGINDKMLNILDILNDMGYLVYCDIPTRTAIGELKMDMDFIDKECENNFSLLYFDEIEKIMDYKRDNSKDAHLNSFSILLVLTYLRKKIFRRPNELKPEERSPEKIRERKERLPEAYNGTYKEIGKELGLTANTVSKAVKILEQLKLIVVEDAYHVKLKESGEYRTSYTMFANYEKRENKYLLASGLDYAHGEMLYKMKKINKESYCEYRLKIADAS